MHGIGSETRDLLPVISNHKDILCLVTCEHNREEWRRNLNQIELQQCDANIREYHRPQFVSLQPSFRSGSPLDLFRDQSLIAVFTRGLYSYI